MPSKPEVSVFYVGESPVDFTRKKRYRIVEKDLALQKRFGSGRAGLQMWGNRHHALTLENPVAVQEDVRTDLIENRA